MNRFFLSALLFCVGGVAFAQTPPVNPNPLGQPGRGNGSPAFTRPTTRNSIALAEETVLLRHYEKLLEMKLETELQMELALVKKGDNHPELKEAANTVAVLSKRMDQIRARLEEKIKTRQAELQEQQQRRSEAPSVVPFDRTGTENLKVYNLKKGDAAKVVEVMKTMKILNKARFNVDQRTNSILVLGVSENHELAEALIQKLDRDQDEKKDPPAPK